MIRGVDSNGMLCSMREMGLGEDHDGIIELPDDAPVGTRFAALLGLDDPVIELKLTPNRADCLGVRGIARDLAAAGLGTLKPFDADAGRGHASSRRSQWQRTDDGHACPLFVGRYFRGVRNGPSPHWLQDRLNAIGLRPISALVDITNFVTFDLSRPLHVFDADKLDGRSRPCAWRGRARSCWRWTATNTSWSPAMVGDRRRPRRRGSAASWAASRPAAPRRRRNVFLEAALFDPVRTARTGRKLGIDTDARYRFERGVDPAFADWGIEVATRLILELCGGEASDVIRAGERPEWRRVDRLPAGALGHAGRPRRAGEPAEGASCEARLRRRGDAASSIGA